MEYELFYLVRASQEAGVEEIKKEAEGIVEKAGGIFSPKTTVEKRRLSYEVKHETHGIYIARRFELEDGEAIKKITKNLNLNGNILRFIISRTDELPPLKSKEERMEEAKNEKREEKMKKSKRDKEAQEIKFEKTKKEQVEVSDSEGKADYEEKKEEADRKDKKIEDEDIDKKLEEILNI